MKRLAVILCAILLHTQPGGVFTQNVSRSFIYTTNPYDSIITVTVNSTIEHIMDFYEPPGKLVGFPTRVHVSSNDTINGEHPLFITATQQKGISSWELPLVIQTTSATLRFNDMARTLCPLDAASNNSAAPVNRPTVHVSTSSPTNVTLAIKLRRVADFDVIPDNETSVKVTPSTPHYYHFSFKGKAGKASKAPMRYGFNYTIPKSVILIIESDDDICAVVSIQNDSCPVFDNEHDVLYSGYYLTMTRKGGITLTDSMFPDGFFIVFIVKENDADCTGVSETVTQGYTNASGTADGYTIDRGGVSVVTNDGRVKHLRFRIVATISYVEYVVGALATLAIIIMIALFALMAQCVSGPNGETSTQVAAPSTPAEVRSEVSLLPNVIRQDSSTDSEPDLGVTPPRMTLSGLSGANVTAQVRRSNRYFWSSLTVAVVYALPVVQLLFTYQKMVFQTGNQDLCYYNFLCAHPLGFLSDFNHVYSNIGYVILGVVFMGQTRVRQIGARNRPQVGGTQHHGLFYSMALALVMEGILSACYHLCPNKMNFQFDSSFMYVIAVLCMVNLYQNRHPDVNASAHSTFMLLATIMAVGLFGIMYPSVYFWVIFTIAHLAICLVLTMKIYYVGQFQFDSGILQRAYSSVRSHGRRALLPDYTARAILLTIANSANIALAIFGLYEHKKDFARHMLAILMGNTIIYTLSYVVMKLVHRERILAHTWLYLFLAHVAWIWGLLLFLDSKTKWSQTPSTSRRHNSQCSVLRMFDSHDAWHVASAAALYLSFNLLLTIDDGLQGRDQNDRVLHRF